MGIQPGACELGDCPDLEIQKLPHKCLGAHGRVSVLKQTLSAFPNSPSPDFPTQGEKVSFQVKITYLKTSAPDNG